MRCTCVCVCVNGSCCGPGPGGPRGWPRQADFSHVVPSHKLPAFTSITFTGTSWVVANTGQGHGGNIQGNFWRSASCEALRLFLLSRIEILNYKSIFLQNGKHSGSDLSYKVNRCLARYSPRATTTIQPTYRFLREGVKLLVPSYQGTNETPLCVENIDRWGSNGPLGRKMCNFESKIWIFGAKS